MATDREDYGDVRCRPSGCFSVPAGERRLESFAFPRNLRAVTKRLFMNELAL